MSICVNDVQWEPGKNDAEYIKLLKSSRDEWQKIAQKAIAKLKTLSKAQEPVEPILDYDGRDVWRCGNCHRNIFHPTRTDEDENEKNYRRFCFYCGRAVKWE